MVVFFFCLIRMIVRRDWIATTVFTILTGAIIAGGGPASETRRPR
jgi:hypothetical protein